MDRRIIIQRYDEIGRNGYNEPILDWVLVASVWAGRMDVSDAEKVSASHEQSALVTRFSVRHSPDTASVSAADRISYDGRIWNITGVKEMAQGRDHFREITAVSDG